MGIRVSCIGSLLQADAMSPGWSPPSNPASFSGVSDRRLGNTGSASQGPDSDLLSGFAFLNLSKLLYRANKIKRSRALQPWHDLNIPLHHDLLSCVGGFRIVACVDSMTS